MIVGDVERMDSGDMMMMMVCGWRYYCWLVVVELVGGRFGNLHGEESGIWDQLCVALCETEREKEYTSDLDINWPSPDNDAGASC